MDIETKNLDRGHVCRDERWLTHRATIPFALLDSNGLRDVYKYKIHILESRRKFFGDSQSPSSSLLKLSFLRSHMDTIWVNEYNIVKNTTDWRFLHQKMDFCVVRPSGLLEWIVMMIEMLEKTNSMSWWVIENFFRALKVTQVVLKHYILVLN